MGQASTSTMGSSSNAINGGAGGGSTDSRAAPGTRLSTDTAAAGDPGHDLARAATVRRDTTATPAEVWAVIADGWTYAAWVVGASRVRSVDPGWPAVGALLHHSVGSWPAVLNDSTTVIEAEPGHRIRLSARTRPLGVETVEISVRATDGGSVVEMREDGSHGPIRLLPRPVRQAALTMRNREALHRLCLLAERSGDPAQG